MEYIIENWQIVVLLIAVTAVAVVFAIRFAKAPTDQKIIMVKSWLLQAVTEAEKQFGSKTGSIKLSYVYNLFLTTFPKLEMVISFEMFSGLVDEVLERFRVMLESNQSLRDYVYGETKTEAPTNTEAES